MAEIDKDLIRWKRGKWITAIAFIFAVQLAVIFGSSQKLLPVREIYPKETSVAFSAPGFKVEQPWLELENPFLFAAASRDGFSGEAWFRKPEWVTPHPEDRIEPRFLSYAESLGLSTREPSKEFTLATPRRLRPVFPAPPDQSTTPHASQLRLDGLEGRPLATQLPLPEQFHTDVLSSTLVEVLIDRDGLVVSARLIANSGSPKADGDALALARQARFTPSPDRSSNLALGKLIFEWYALDLSHTNNVKR